MAATEVGRASFCTAEEVGENFPVFGVLPTFALRKTTFQFCQIIIPEVFSTRACAYSLSRDFWFHVELISRA
jgi:hypothetical protein